MLKTTPINFLKEDIDAVCFGSMENFISSADKVLSESGIIKLATFQEYVVGIKDGDVVKCDIKDGKVSKIESLGLVKKTAPEMVSSGVSMSDIPKEVVERYMVDRSVKMIKEAGLFVKDKMVSYWKIKSITENLTDLKLENIDQLIGEMKYSKTLCEAILAQDLHMSSSVLADELNSFLTVVNKVCEASHALVESNQLDEENLVKELQPDYHRLFLVNEFIKSLSKVL